MVEMGSTWPANVAKQSPVLAVADGVGDEADGEERDDIGHEDNRLSLLPFVENPALIGALHVVDERFHRLAYSVDSLPFYSCKGGSQIAQRPKKQSDAETPRIAVVPEIVSRSFDLGENGIHRRSFDYERDSWMRIVIGEIAH